MNRNLHAPWTARCDTSGGEPGYWSVIDSDGAIVFFGMRENIAHLIAAAPDLLAALKALVPPDFDEHPQDFAQPWHDAVAALRKADPAGGMP